MSAVKKRSTYNFEDMKNKSSKTISLKKFTIARIDKDQMYQVHGGSSFPTTDEINEDSRIYCEDSHTP